ncbi:hypothetical protein Hdeb2414_s0357g00875741 [Helianthus debilis subsp. tardiflorus]
MSNVLVRLMIPRQGGVFGFLPRHGDTSKKRNNRMLAELYLEGTIFHMFENHQPS